MVVCKRKVAKHRLNCAKICGFYTRFDGWVQCSMLIPAAMEKKEVDHGVGGYHIYIYIRTLWDYTDIDSVICVFPFLPFI